MDATPTNPAENAPAGFTGKPSASQVLLHVIALLIDAGRDCLATIRADLTPHEVQDTGFAFGTFNLAVILNRVMRGIKLALALQAHVEANAKRIDNPRLLYALPTRKNRARPPRKPKLTEAEDNAALLARMPTDAEIAAMLRHRTIGAVLADICADLGIGMAHPLWQEVKFLIVIHGAPMVPSIKRTFNRVNAARREVLTGIAPGWNFYCDWGPTAEMIEGETTDTTGPPPDTVTA